MCYKVVRAMERLLIENMFRKLEINAKNRLTKFNICNKIKPPNRWFYFAQNEGMIWQSKEKI